MGYCDDHAVDSILDDCEGVLAFDLSNAFNEVSRKAIFEELHQFLPGLVPFVSSFYANPTPLWLRMGNRYRRLHRHGWSAMDTRSACTRNHVAGGT